MGVTRDLANFVLDTNFDDLEEEVIEHAKVCILDWLGAALAGSLEPPAKIITSIIREMGERKESTIIGTRIGTSCTNAALANGIMGHTIELDDIHEESIIHPAAPVVPAALAVAEHNGASGKDLITSIVLGYEVEIRIGMAVMPSHYQYWHMTGTCGTFGAAVAAGKILGLNREEMVHALGIAGTQASGLIEVFGTMSKPLNAGRAALSGVMAALLAQRGFTSSSTILEAKKGYCQATSRKYDLSKISENLGARFEIMNNIFKRHASCGHTHGAIDALLDLARKYDTKPDDVEEILVGTYPIAVEIVGKNPEPKTGSEGKFSLLYCLAAALICGKLGLAEFSKERLMDPKILELSKKVRVEVDKEFVGAQLGCARVTLRTVDGRSLSCRVDVPKGYPKNPLTKAELEEKFRSLASIVLSSEQVEKIIITLKKLNELDNVRFLTALLQGQ